MTGAQLGHGGRAVYVGEDEMPCVASVVFADGSARDLVFALMGREIDHVEVDGERFERVRECDMEPTFAEPGNLAGNWQEWECSECGDFSYIDVVAEGERPDYCQHCGAKRKETT